MKQIRANVTIDSGTGKITRAMLQETDYFDENGHVHWEDVRELELTPDGEVVLFRGEPANIEYSTQE
jgi:hypothetical protein